MRWFIEENSIQNFWEFLNERLLDPYQVKFDTLKLMKNAKEGTLVGFCKRNAYCKLLRDQNTRLESRDVQFPENVFVSISWPCKSTIDFDIVRADTILDKNPNVSDSTASDASSSAKSGLLPVSTGKHSVISEQLHKQNETTVQISCYPRRVWKHPKLWHSATASETIRDTDTFDTNTFGNIPLLYKTAALGWKGNKWECAMWEKIQSLTKLSAWQLVQKLKDRHTIKCRSVFDIKLKME